MTRRDVCAAIILSAQLLGSTAAAVAAPPALKHIDKSALAAVLDATMRQLMVPGAVVLLQTPQGNFTFTPGTTVLGRAIAPSADTYFRIASNTKTMTAAVIMQLAQENRLRLGDPASKYVAGVPNGRNITIAELLEMRSGLYNYTNSPKLAAGLDGNPGKVWSEQELLNIAVAHPPNFAPGAQYEYCNTNYLLLGMIVERLDRKSLAESMRSRLFGPLGMVHTFLPPRTDATLPSPYSHGYLYGSSSVALYGGPPYTAAMKAAARAGTLLPTDFTGLNHSFASAAGGVVSTADDLAVWIRALVEGRVFDATYQHEWLDSIRPEDAAKPKGPQYGYGIARLQWGPNAMYFHGGETPGYNSFMGYDPANRVTLIVWTNLTVSLDDTPAGNSLMLKVLDQIYSLSPLPPQPTASSTKRPRQCKC